MLQLVRWCLVVVVACGAASARAADFFFKDGDTVVMIGDSITEQHLYSNYVELWTVTRFPGWKLTFRNVGIGGDRSVGGNSRFARDVLLYKPTAMTVDFGMNDGSYRTFEEGTFRPYMDGLQGMANQAKAAGIRVAWCTPQPLDTGDQGATALTGYNETLEKFSDGVKVIAEKNGGLFVDQFHPYLAALDRARAKGPKYDRITGGDAVHPGPPGQALMAASILKGLNFPALVSSAEIDVTGKVTAVENCKIENVVAKEGGVSFSRLDGALPYFPASANPILPSAPILEELNNYRLKVTGLATGKYEVRVGGKKVAELTSVQLAEGANLAAGVLNEGPIAEQVKAVTTAVTSKNQFHHDAIYRGVILNSNVPDWVYNIVPKAELEAKKKALLDERYAKLPGLDADVAKSLVMKANTFDIVPVK
ncbi:MAG: GDSL-like Lipase/Acylhydrolase [Planctomycetaceae bacterium]|nr:GDSL-like Lipase/Acylhydrolase [Planctomycetaceae bacterium]